MVLATAKIAHSCMLLPRSGHRYMFFFVGGGRGEGLARTKRSKSGTEHRGTAR